MFFMEFKTYDINAKGGLFMVKSKYLEVCRVYPILTPLVSIIMGIFYLFGFWYCVHCKEFHHLKTTKKSYSKHTHNDFIFAYSCSKQYGC